MESGRLAQIAARLIEPGRPHLQIERTGFSAHGEHEAELGTVDGAQGGILSLLGAHHQQRVILPHPVATHQQQLAAGVDGAVIGIIGLTKQRGAIDDAVSHQIDRTQERLDGDLLAQHQQVVATGSIHQGQHGAVGLLRMIQHRLHQGSGLVCRGAGFRFQLLHIIAVDEPSSHQQRQGKDQQGTAEA